MPRKPKGAPVADLQDALQRNQVGADDPKPRGRSKAQELPLNGGPGVDAFEDAEIESLGDEFISVRDKKAKLAEKLGDLDKKMVERMVELEITRYRFSDQVAEIKPGTTHIKIKTVTANGESDED